MISNQNGERINLQKIQYTIYNNKQQKKSIETWNESALLNTGHFTVLEKFQGIVGQSIRKKTFTHNAGRLATLIYMSHPNCIIIHFAKCKTIVFISRNETAIFPRSVIPSSGHQNYWLRNLFCHLDLHIAKCSTRKITQVSKNSFIIFSSRYLSF